MENLTKETHTVNREHNGFPNYQTFAVALMLDSNSRELSGILKYVAERIAWGYIQDGEESWNDMTVVTFTELLQKCIEYTFESYASEKIHGFTTPFISSISWRHVAESIMPDELVNGDVDHTYPWSSAPVIRGVQLHGDVFSIDEFPNTFTMLVQIFF